MPTLSGPFEVSMSPEPPYDTRDGITLGRVAITKTFRGPLAATSSVQMTAARTAVPTSAAYVAIERVEGSVEGRAGSFVLVHVGRAEGGTNSLSVDVVPDSGTGELVGIRGSMRIRIEEGMHHYDFDYVLP